MTTRTGAADTGVSHGLPVRPRAVDGRGNEDRASEARRVGSRGLGFVSREGGGDEVFRHVSNLQAGAATLAEGQTVEVEVGPGRRREDAKNVRPVSRATPQSRGVASAAQSSPRATALARHRPFEPRAG